MLTIKKITYNPTTECNSCGKVRKEFYEIRYGILVRDFPWQPYSTLPLCKSCLKKLNDRIEKALERRLTHDREKEIWNDEDKKAAL